MPRRRAAVEAVPDVNPVMTFREHLAHKIVAATETERAESLKKRLKEWIKTASDTYTNENGSIFYDLPETVEVFGQNFKGFELRRSTPTSFDEEKAEPVLTQLDLLTEAQSTLTYIDQDKVARLHQQGKITDEQLDSMFTTGESFAFYATKGEVH